MEKAGNINILIVWKLSFRTQLNSLTHKHQKDVEQIKNAMQVFKCESCKSNQANIVPEPAVEGKVEFNPIGVIKTIFPEKRAGNLLKYFLRKLLRTILRF